ncbi:hypothetical protein QBC36DRAFT_332701, partial [Triangularia setosa]
MLLQFLVMVSLLTTVLDSSHQHPSHSRPQQGRKHVHLFHSHPPPTTTRLIRTIALLLPLLPLLPLLLLLLPPLPRPPPFNHLLHMPPLRPNREPPP